MKERGIFATDTCRSRERFAKRSEITSAIRSMPAPDIPLRRGRGHEGIKSVARHESKHAKVAIKMRIGMSRLTVKRSGDVLGSVTPVKTDNTAAFQITAMASSVDSHPEGTGSDVYTARMLESAPGAISADSAKQVAEGIVGQYSDLYWDTLSDLVAHEPDDVTESRFKQLEARTEWEVNMIKKYGKPIPIEEEGIIFDREDNEQLAA